MAVKVLGPLDTGTDPLSPRERAILSALIVRLGASMSPGELADAYWGEKAPASWPAQVKTAVARIRARVGAETILTTTGGYEFGLAPEAVDAVQFERLVSTARGHALRQQQDRAVDAYRKALALWRGSPYPDLGDWEPGSAERVRLVEIRTSAEEELLESRLATGQRREVIPDAERLVREQPYREDRWAILATANYRTDRQAQALAVIRTARRRLLEDLGIEPGQRLAALETAILRQDPSLAVPEQSTAASIECPYRGLQAFGPDDADVFFGRDADVERVVGTLRPGSLVAIAGPSGSGKSSVLLAGVVPRLRETDRPVELLRFGGTTPGPRTVIARAGSTGAIVLDQAEELFSSLDRGGVEEFCRAARDHLDGGGAIVATIRSDFLDRATALPHIGTAIAHGVVLLGALGPDAIRAAIEEPARGAGLVVEPGLTEVVLRDAGGRSAVLPHLSHALLETWVRREGNTLTVAGYEAAGGIAGAIAQSAEQLYTTLSPHEQDLTRSLMLRLIARNPDGVSVRRSVPIAPLLDDLERRGVLEGLVSARLVEVDGERVLIAHEAVATAWPRLDGWLAEDAEGARLLQQVEAAAAGWQAGGRGEEDLFRGARLQATLDWRSAAVPDLTETEGAFLDASEEHALAEQRALAQRAHRDRQQNRRLRWSLAGVGVLLATALSAGGVAVVRSQDATRASADARIEALTATSLALRSSSPDVAALLAAEAYRRWPDDPRVHSALWGSMVAAGPLIGRVPVPDSEATASAIIPGTRLAVAIRERYAAPPGGSPVWEPNLALIDIDTGAVVRDFGDAGIGAGAQAAHTIDVSDDGRFAVVDTALSRASEQGNLCCSNRLDVFDLTTGQQLPGSQLLDARTGTQWLVESDGRAYTPNPVTGHLTAVDLYTGQVHHTAEVSPDATQDVFAEHPHYGITSLDTGRLAVSGGPGFTLDETGRVVPSPHSEVTVYDRHSLEVLQRAPVPSGFSENDLTPDGAGGVVGVGTAGISRVDLGSGTLAWHHPTIAYDSVVADLSTGLVYAGDENGNVDEYSLDTGKPTGRRFTMPAGSSGEPVVTEPGRELAFQGGAASTLGTGNRTGFVHWRLDGTGPASTLVAAGLMTWDGFAGNGAMLLVAPRPEQWGDGSQYRLWDVAADRPLGTASGGLALVNDGFLLDWAGDPPSFIDIATGKSTPVIVDPATGVDLARGWFWQGNQGPHAFYLDDERIVAYDPATGAPVGSPMRFPDDVLEAAALTWNDSVSTISESAWGDRVVVSWWGNDGADGMQFTSVFDLATGEEVVRGLDNTGWSAITSTGELVGTDADRITLSSPDTLEVHRTLPKPSPRVIQLTVARDKNLMTILTFNRRVWLYDLTAGILLGDPVVSQFTDSDQRPPAFLSPDGRALAVNNDRGVLVYNLDPAAQAAAACTLAGRELTADEWNSYLGDLGPQRPTCG